LLNKIIQFKHIRFLFVVAVIVVSAPLSRRSASELTRVTTAISSPIPAIEPVPEKNTNLAIIARFSSGFFRTSWPKRGAGSSSSRFFLRPPRAHCEINKKHQLGDYRSIFFEFFRRIRLVGQCATLLPSFSRLRHAPAAQLTKIFVVAVIVVSASLSRRSVSELTRVTTAISSPIPAFEPVPENFGKNFS